MIRFENISKEYNPEEKVLSHVEFTIKENEFFVIVGPSGSGKTTLLKMINRLIEPTDGNLYFKDKRIKDYDIKTLRMQIGYVLQQIALFPNLTVSENIELIPELKKWKKEARRERAIELLQKVDMEPKQYLDRKPEALSGGEQQRVGILRALAAEPEIILMDEPFSALDPISRQQLQHLIKKIHQEIKSTIIFVTHDMNEALLLGDRICIMQNGEVVQIDTPKNIQEDPVNDFVSAFFTTGEPVKKTASILKQTLRSFLGEPIQKKKNESVSRLGQVSLDTCIEEVIQQLYHFEAVNVMDQEKLLYILDRVDILQILEEELKGENL